jgi:WD40 repeat protein
VDVEFSEDSVDVQSSQVLEHDGEVWLMSPCPSDGRQLLTYAGQGNPKLRLWRAEEKALQLVASVTDDNTALTMVKSILWDAHSEDSVVVADAESLHVFKKRSGGTFSNSLSLDVGQRCNAACLDPHHPQQVSTVDDTHLKTWDLRASKVSFRREGAHLFGARDVDYNPNVPYQVLTTGEDAELRFWDLRQLRAPLKALSCGTDSAVCLWRASSVASAPLGAEAVTDTAADGLIRRFEDHEDSVYGCCWSAADAWVFASVSYDGKFVVNRVPGDEKYRILL